MAAAACCLGFVPRQTPVHDSGCLARGALIELALATQPRHLLGLLLKTRGEENSCGSGSCSDSILDLGQGWGPQGPGAIPGWPGASPQGLGLPLSIREPALVFSLFLPPPRFSCGDGALKIY